MSAKKITDFADLEREADDLALQIKPLLFGHHPAVVAAALAEMVTLWAAGHHPAARDKQFKMLVDQIRRAYPLAAAHFWDGDVPVKKPKFYPLATAHFWDGDAPVEKPKKKEKP